MPYGRSHRARARPAWWCSPPTPAFEQRGARDLRRHRSAIELARRRRHASPSGPTRSTPQDATVVVVDLDAGRAEEMAALARLMARVGARPPVVAVTQSFDAERRAHAAADAGRRFPGQAGAAGRSGAHLRARRQAPPARDEPTEAQIYTFLPAVGGAGVTTLAIQTALLLLNSGAARPDRRPAWSISISSTAPAPTISISSRGSISTEIEPRPERLDRQLLEVMLSHHASGPRGDRGAEPAGRDAHRSIPTW